jgi:hypothetical protein
MKRVLIVLSLLLLLGGCSQAPVAKSNDGRVNHVVLIWLKDSSNPEQRQQIIEATRALRQIPGVVSIRVGSVMPSDRNIVDDSFDVGIHMLFADRQSMEHYTSNPEHVRTVNQIVMPLTKRLVIYDFEE